MHTPAPTVSLSITQTHTNAHAYTCIHKYSYTSRNRGSNSLTESLSPHVDNVTFSVFHYLVLTIREHLSLSPLSLSISLSRSVFILGSVGCLRGTVIPYNCHSYSNGATLQFLHRIWRGKRVYDPLMSVL